MLTKSKKQISKKQTPIIRSKENKFIKDLRLQNSLIQEPEKELAVELIPDNITVSLYENKKSLKCFDVCRIENVTISGLVYGDKLIIDTRAEVLDNDIVMVVNNKKGCYLKGFGGYSNGLLDWVSIGRLKEVRNKEIILLNDINGMMGFYPKQDIKAVYKVIGVTRIKPIEEIGK